MWESLGNLVGCQMHQLHPIVTSLRDTKFLGGTLTSRYRIIACSDAASVYLYFFDVIYACVLLLVLIRCMYGIFQLAPLFVAFCYVTDV